MNTFEDRGTFYINIYNIFNQKLFPTKKLLLALMTGSFTFRFPFFNIKGRARYPVWWCKTMFGEHINSTRRKCTQDHMKMRD